MTGKMEQVQAIVDKNIVKMKEYKDPTQTLPVPPPKSCQNKNCGTCENCINLYKWKEQFENTVDDLVL